MKNKKAMPADAHMPPVLAVGGLGARRSARAPAECRRLPSTVGRLAQSHRGQPGQRRRRRVGAPVELGKVGAPNVGGANVSRGLLIRRALQPQRWVRLAAASRWASSRATACASRASRTTRPGGTSAQPALTRRGACGTPPRARSSCCRKATPRRSTLWPFRPTAPSLPLGALQATDGTRGPGARYSRRHAHGAPPLAAMSQWPGRERHRVGPAQRAQGARAGGPREERPVGGLFAQRLRGGHGQRGRHGAHLGPAQAQVPRDHPCAHVAGAGTARGGDGQTGALRGAKPHTAALRTRNRPWGA